MYFINGFYLYPKYLKPHLMAHCCNFAGRGSLPPPCRPAGGRQAPAKGLRANNFFLFTYKSLPPPCRAAGV